MKIIVLLCTILFPFYIFGENSVIKAKPLKYSAHNDFENRLEEQEQEIRKLLGRIEVLEHRVLSLDKQPLSNNESGKNLTEVADAPIDYATPDIFDVSLLKDIPDAPASVEIKPTVTQAKVVASDKQAYDLALASYKDNKINEAREKFKNFIKNYPNSTMLSNVYFWYGECFFKQKDYNQAAVNYLKSYKENPKGPKASDGLLKLALSLGELKKTSEACNMLMKFDQEFSNSKTAASKKMAEDAKAKFSCKNQNKK